MSGPDAAWREVEAGLPPATHTITCTKTNTRSLLERQPVVTPHPHRRYPDRIDVAVPDGSSGMWSVSTFTVTKEQEYNSRLRAAIDRRRLPDVVTAGTYKRLTHHTEATLHLDHGECVMSNVPMEIRTNWEFLREARGRILINGLGLGMVLTYLLQHDDVAHVTVVEISADVIALVGPVFANNPRVTIIHADALTWSPPRGTVYDYVWHDIWTWIGAGNLPDMRRLHRRSWRWARWQRSWRRRDCELKKWGR